MPTPYENQALFEVELSFQGGGAKLIPLLAVAEAIFERFPELNIGISRISGSSAGAIIAALLATGVHPTKFREKLKILGPQFIPNDYGLIVNLVRGIFCSVLGIPIIGKKRLQSLLEKLLEVDGKKFEFGKDLMVPVSVFATDLRSKSVKELRIEGDERIIDALLRSAAIPFVFHSYWSTDQLVDGGLLNNLPVSHTRDEEEEYRRTIAVTFSGNTKEKSSFGLLNYSSALLSTLVDVHVDKSIGLLPKDNVHFIRTDTDTFEFTKAIQVDLEKKYADYKNDFLIFIKNYKESYLSYLPVLNAEKIASTLIDLHEANTSEHLISVESALYKWKCNCCKLDNKDELDTLDVEFYVRPLRGPVLSIGIQHIADKDYYDIGEIEVSVFDGDDKIPSYTFPFTPELMKSRKERNNLVIFFHKPLNISKLYKISYQIYATQVLYDAVRPGGEDYISYTVVNCEAVKELTLIAYIPPHMKTTRIVPKSGEANYGNGIQLSNAETERFGNVAGFKAIGWRAVDLRRGQYTGFVVQNVLPRAQPRKGVK